MPDYVECPFCDRIFVAEAFHSLMHGHPLEDHIRDDHDKVKLRKGSNYRWVDRKEVEARLLSRRAARPTRATRS
jgi:hypothetical protein